jgi:hypothetical protein
MKRKLFVSSNISLQIRKNLVKAYVWSNAWYGSETWIIGDTQRRRLEAFSLMPKENDENKVSGQSDKERCLLKNWREKKFVEEFC